jgi:hypothetical protein
LYQPLAEFVKDFQSRSDEPPAEEYQHFSGCADMIEF